MWCFDICVHCEMITTNYFTHPLSPIVITVCMCVYKREQPLSKFQVYSILLLLTIDTMLYTWSPGLIHLVTESLYPLISISHFSLTPSSLWYPPFYLGTFFCFCSFFKDQLIMSLFSSKIFRDSLMASEYPGSITCKSWSTMNLPHLPSEPHPSFCPFMHWLPRHTELWITQTTGNKTLMLVCLCGFLTLLIWILISVAHNVFNT